MSSTAVFRFNTTSNGTVKLEPEGAGLTLTYALYGYLFHLGFDRLRPVCISAIGGR